VSAQAIYRTVAKGSVALLLVVAVVGLLRRFPPDENAFYPKCVLYHWTGLHCPGCGGTRAVAALVQGDLVEAIHWNPLLIVGGPVIATLLWWLRRKQRISGQGSPRLIWGLFVVLIVYAIARNLPSPTRSWLAPSAAVDAESSLINPRRNEAPSLVLAGEQTNA